MKKVAVVTLYGDFNFGNKLQNYAVQEIVKKLDYECRTICCQNTARAIGWKGRLVAFLGFPGRIARVKRELLKNRDLFRPFSDKYLLLGEMLEYRDIHKISGKYDYFMVGSDQVWGCRTAEQIDYFFLRSVPYYKRLCISPSFGMESVPEKLRQQYTAGLNGFKHLSCREESGCKLIKELTGREAQLLCDPTMALTAEQWDEISVRPAFSLPERYILTYFLGDAPEEAVDYAKELSEREGIPVINLYNRDYPEYASVQPDEFLYLVKHAEHFCTTSFHGCVFSIIYHTPFNVFERNDMKGMHGRIETLLKTFSLESCDAGNGTLGVPCDFSLVDEVISSERKKMYDYLTAAFSDAELGECKD